MLGCNQADAILCSGWSGGGRTIVIIVGIVSTFNIIVDRIVLGMDGRTVAIAIVVSFVIVR